MITHYDIKMEMQKLKEVLSVEGVNIPSLLQVIKPGTYVFLWVLLWPTFLRLVSVKSDVRDVGFDICASGMMGFLLFVAITNGMMLYLAIPDSFRKDSKIINFMYSKSKTYILLFLIVFLWFRLCILSYMFCTNDYIHIIFLGVYHRYKSL